MMPQTKMSVGANRQTKYVAAVVESLQRLKHATNTELLDDIRKTYPEVSATTIHRVTSRLQSRGLIGLAPKLTNGAERFDSSLEPHHHFMCVTCGKVCDVPGTTIADGVIEQLKELSGECELAGTLTLSGVCKKCNKEEKQ